MTAWFVQNWGDIANVVGLALTFYVLVVSKRAEQAAQEAKLAIEKRSLGQDLRGCIDSVNSIGLFCDNYKWDTASFICNRLTHDLTFIANRWAALLGNENRETLSLLLTQLDTLNDQIRKFIARPAKQIELLSLTSAIQRINKLLAALIGSYESQVNS
jgi:hypothetical protein